MPTRKFAAAIGVAVMAPWGLATAATELECSADATPYGGSVIRIALMRSPDGHLQASTDGKVTNSNVVEERHAVRRDANGKTPGLQSRDALNPAEQMLETMKLTAQLPALPSGKPLPPAPIDESKVVRMTMYALTPGKFGQGWLIRPFDAQGRSMGLILTAGLGFAIACR